MADGQNNTDPTVSDQASVWAAAFTSTTGHTTAPAPRADIPEMISEFPTPPSSSPQTLEPEPDLIVDEQDEDDTFDELFADLAMADDTEEPTEDPQPVGFPEPPPGPVAAPVSPAAAQQILSAAAKSPTVAQARANSQRYRDGSKLYEYVRFLRDIAATDENFGDTLRELVLTADPAVDAAQRTAMNKALTQAMSRQPGDIARRYPPNTVEQTVLEMLYDDAVGIGPLGPLWRDPDVTEIIVRGPDTVLVERIGTNLTPDVARYIDLEHLRSQARELSQKLSGRALSPTSPLVTAELPGARVQFVYDPVTRDHVFIAIRKFRPMLSMQALIDNASVTPQMATLLADLVAARATILVSGGTGSGKTSMINALSEFIAPTEHVVTIEDAYELRLTHPNVTSMQTKEKASADDLLLISQADLLVASLRMRPDRIIVGEIREGKGAETMMRAASTGHDGSMTTLHANSAHTAVAERLPDLLLEHKNIPMPTARRTVANAIDVVVHVTRRAGRRFVSTIAMVDNTMISDEDLTPLVLFSYDGTTGTLEAPIPSDSDLGQRMADAGIGAQWRSTP